MPNTSKVNHGRHRLLLFLLVSPFVVAGAGLLAAPKANSDLLEIGRTEKPSTAQSPPEIRIVSYNIRWRGGDDLRKLIQLFKNDAEIGNATIIGLQEVDRNKKRTGNLNTIRVVAEELEKHYAWAAPPPPKADEEEETGVAILSNYPLTDVRRILLPHEGPGRRRRVAIGATVNIAGVPVRFYSAHSENRMSVKKKLEQTNAILADLAQYPKDMRAVVLGDLNTWEPDAVVLTSELFLREKFTTPFDNDESTFIRRIIIPIKMKLDWIWLRGLESTNHGIDRKVTLSDHFPLWTVVKLNRSVMSLPEPRS